MSACEPLDRLLGTLRMRVPGSTDAGLTLELFNTIDEFFRRTNAWRWLTDVNLTQGQLTYPIYPPSGTALVRMLYVAQNGRPIPAAGDAASGPVISQRGRFPGDTLFPDGDAAFDPDRVVNEGAVMRYAIYFPTYVTIDIPPSADAVQYPLQMALALTLAGSAIECDCGDWGLEEWMFDTFFEDWLDGTQGRMFSQIAKPYSNIAGATYHLKRFRQAMAYRKQEARRGFSYNTPSWRYPQGGFITRHNRLIK
jgi:hypothetical protein